MTTDPKGLAERLRDMPAYSRDELEPYELVPFNDKVDPNPSGVCLIATTTRDEILAALEALSVQPEAGAVAPCAPVDIRLPELMATITVSVKDVQGQIANQLSAIAAWRRRAEWAEAQLEKRQPLYASPTPASGMVMVPREPTDAMLLAGATRAKRDDSLMQKAPSYYGEARNIYKAMLSAVPQASMPSMGEKDGAEKM